MKDHYQTLGVDRTADDSALKSAYRKLAKENHPDTNKAPGAEARFKEINEAYEILKDPNKRAQYDASRAGPRPGQGPQFQWSTHSSPHGFTDLDEILRDIRRSRSPYGHDAKNRDIMLSYAITLEEAFHGKEAEISYNIPSKPTQTIKFKITPGVNDGVKIRFQGKGDDSMAGVPAGDLYVRINVVPHPGFDRVGPHLVTQISIDYLDALLGADREIPTIEGSKIKMRVPAGILPGQSLRAAGKGMTIAEGVRGDMMVEVLFNQPQLSPEQIRLVEEARNLRS